MAIKTKSNKVNAGYRLPQPLVRQIRQQAAKEGVQPCRVAERWLVCGSQVDGQHHQIDDTQSSDSQ